MIRQLLLLALASVTTSCQAAADREAAPALSDTGAATYSAVDSSQRATEDSAAPPNPVNVQQPGTRLLTPDGWGPLRIGMSRAQVVAAAGQDANPDAVGGPDPATCDEFRPDSAPAGVLVMIEDGVLTRISVSRNTDIASPEGIRVGDSGTEVLRAYGAQATVTNHQYWNSPAKYITVWRPSAAGQPRRGILYEVNSADEVVFIRGGSSSIERVEGCV